MTIKELYYFAINHSLLDEEVNNVIEKYTKEIKPKESLNLDKVEYTTEDLMILFSD